MPKGQLVKRNGSICNWVDPKCFWRLCCTQICFETNSKTTLKIMLIEASQFKFPKYSQILYVSVILPFTSTKTVRQVSTSAGLLPRRYPEIRGINARSYFMTHFHFEALLWHCYSTRSTRIKHLPAPHANRLGFWKYWADTGSLLFAVSPGRSRSRMQHDATLSQFSPVPRWGRRGRKSFPFKHIWGVLTVAYWTSSLSWHVMTLEGSQWSIAEIWKAIFDDIWFVSSAMLSNTCEAGELCKRFVCAFGLMWLWGRG